MHKAYLSELSDSQVAFSATFLEDVFLHRKTRLAQFRPEELNAICVLIKSVPTSQMKASMLGALDSLIQIQIAQKLEDAELKLLFDYHPDLPVLKLIFQSLPEYRKALVKDARFDAPSVARAPEPTSPEELQRLIRAELNDLRQLILDKNCSVSKLQDYVLEVEKRIPITHFELISKHLIAEFTRLNIPLTTKENFLSYLKLYTFLVPYLVMFPKLNVSILHSLDLFLIALNRLPNGVWVITVLGQLPKPIIELCLDRLKAYPRITELQKRRIYSKLLSVIYDNAHIPEGAHVRALLEGL